MKLLIPTTLTTQTPDENKSFQIKGTIELQDSGPIFDEMKGINPEKHPGHSAAVIRVREIFSGAEQLV